MASLLCASGVFFGAIFLGLGSFIFSMLLSFQRVKPHTPCAGQWGPVTYIHRGNLTFAQENTFDAIVKGSANRGNNPEIDVTSLKDGGAVLFHDENMLRLTGVDKEIKDIDTAEALSTPILQEIDGFVYNSTNSIPELVPVIEAMCDANENIGINFDTKTVEAAAAGVSTLKDSGCTETRDNVIFSCGYPEVARALRIELDNAELDNRLGIYMPSGHFLFVGLKFFLKTRLLQGFIAPGSSIITLHKTVHDAEEAIIQSFVDDGWCIGIWGITLDEVSQYKADKYVVDVEPEFTKNKEVTYDDDSLLYYYLGLVVAAVCLIASVALFYSSFRCMRREREDQHEHDDLRLEEKYDA